MESFNKLVKYSKEISILFIGTITPPEGMAHGYFYSSSRNKLYLWLSEMFNEDLNDEDSFVYLKRKLICEVSQDIKDEVIEKINTKLEKCGIAFFDVVKTADRKKKYSSKDTDLINIVYDIETYKKIKSQINKIIFTSNYAKKMFIDNIDSNFCGETKLLNLFSGSKNILDIKRFIN